MPKKITKIYFIFFLKNKDEGIKKKVISKRLKLNIPIVDRTCKLSCDQEKLQAHKFQGNPFSKKFLRKSDNAKTKLIKKIELKFSSMKLPTKIIGKEKNKDKNNGIKISENGIKNLNVSSNVSE